MLDVRNRFEYAIGHFEDSKERKAMDPNMRNFTQFKHYVKENQSELKGKKILMYCTGGIRCETASAYLKDVVNDSHAEVYQLQGGIHRYCEQYPDGYFKGKNFVFDRRMTMDTKTKAVGKCSECNQTCDVFHSGIVCTVCVCLVLVCDDCRSNGQPSLNRDNVCRRYEWYCKEHQYLSGNYFTFINIYNTDELKRQKKELLNILKNINKNKNSMLLKASSNSNHVNVVKKEIEIKLPNGEIKKKIVQQRKINQKLKNKKNIDPFQRVLTIERQVKLIDRRIQYLQEQTKDGVAVHDVLDKLPLPCRSCKKQNCVNGKCWGFWQSPNSK
eukprot:g9511.t1